MLNLYGAQLETLSIHKVGNFARSEGIFLSNEPIKLNDYTTALLKEYFFKPFREKEENFFEFTHDEDVEQNRIYQLATDYLFKRPDLRHFKSRQIAKHLYEISRHPHIKRGDLYVVHITNIVLDNVKHEALGIFKSEIQHDFIQIQKNGNELDMLVQKGINTNKLDKGCLIIADADNRLKVLSIDNNNYDAKYWLDNFLGVRPMADDNFRTKNYLKFCQDFARDVVRPMEDRQQEVLFINRALAHFGSNDGFHQQDFIAETIQDYQTAQEFNRYFTEKAPKYGLEGVTEFDISNTAVKEVQRKLKPKIELDTNITIKMDFINPESAQKFIEKGWDEERQMYYYLVYFNKEK